jgi:hypothetical protein
VRPEICCSIDYSEQRLWTSLIGKSETAFFERHSSEPRKMEKSRIWFRTADRMRQVPLGDAFAMKELIDQKVSAEWIVFAWIASTYLVGTNESGNQKAT